MKRLFFYFGAALVVFVLLPPIHPCAAGNEDLDGYPLVKGNFWVYRGKTRWTQEGGKVVERLSTVRVDVVEVIKREHLTVAVMKGDPSDYAMEGADDPSYHLMIRVGTATYFDIDAARMPAILEKVRDPKASLFGLLEENEEVVLDLPLVVGKTYGSPAQITRDDRYYCWLVTKEEDFDLSGVNGLGPPGKRGNIRSAISPCPVRYPWTSSPASGSPGTGMSIMAPSTRPT